MNAIDTRIMHAVRDWYAEKGKPPALCIVHPIIYRNKTIDYVRLPLLPTRPIFAFTVIDESGPPPLIDVATVRIMEMDTPYQYVAPEQLIVCLSDMQVMRMLVDHPHLTKQGAS